jgi:DNA (cytosine-5)-methyltransferase 1
VILDLFCGAGGAAMGYHQAGLDAIGVDINPQPRYPFRFVQGDALDVLAGRDLLPPFDAIHASPPCQTRSRATAWRGRREDHPDLLTPTLRALERTSVPWVVENVPEAAWDGTMRADYLLCGTQFGLDVKRHRVFQRGNWDAYDLLPTCRCYRNRKLLPFMHKGERAYADAMGCGWMTKFEGRQAIPPAYTRFIGEQLLPQLPARGTTARRPALGGAW